MVLITLFLAVFGAMLTDWIARTAPCFRVAVVMALLVVFMNNALTSQWWISKNRRDIKNAEIISGMPVITTTVRWGILPLVLWDLEPDTPVFASVGFNLKQQNPVTLAKYPEFFLIHRKRPTEPMSEPSMLTKEFLDMGYENWANCISPNKTVRLVKLSRQHDLELQLVRKSDFGNEESDETTKPFDGFRCSQKIIQTASRPRI